MSALNLVQVLGMAATGIATFFGLRACYAIIQMVDADREYERKARCKEAAERLTFPVGSLANPIITRDGRAYYALVDDVMPVVVEVEP